MPTILLIEDIADNATLVKKVLSAKGYEIIWAKNGEIALDLGAKHSIGLILLDLGLPDIDGQTLVSYLRDVPGLAKTPIIVVTAWPEEHARMMVSAYGCDAYIGKPVDIHELADLVSEYLPL